MKKNMLMFILLLAFLLASCPSINNEDGDSTPEPDVNSSPEPTSDCSTCSLCECESSFFVKSPKVTLVNSSMFDIESFYLGYDDSRSPWIYGICKVAYSGDNDLVFIRVNADFVDIAGNILFSDESFLYQGNGTLIGDLNTSSFVTPEMNAVNYHCIQDLDQYSTSLYDIDSVVIRITASEYNYSPPIGQISIIGNVYEKSPNNFYVDFENTGSYHVNNITMWFHFSDSLSREYLWTYASTFNSDSTKSGWNAGETGYAYAICPSPDFLANCTLEISEIPFYWYSVEAESDENVSNLLLGNIKTFPMTDNEMNQAIQQQMDFATASLMK